MNVFEALEEKAGHALTHVTGPIAGVSTYYCEKCGALVQLYQSVLRLFHVPPGNSSQTGKCGGHLPPRGPHVPRTLREKLRDTSGTF